MKKKALITRHLKKYFSVMSDKSICDDVRSNKLDELRTRIDVYSNKLFLGVVAKELESGNGTFVYKLFLQNIQFIGKL